MECIRPMLLFAFAAISTAAARAQQYELGGPATWTWSASADGSSWQSGVLGVPQSVSNVRIRAHIAFPADHQFRYLGAAYLDAVIVGQNGVGEQDGVTDIARGELPGGPLSQATRFGNVLKIDSLGDELPPGQGPLWFYVVQGPPGSLSRPILSNPILVMQYTLMLDGTPGDRIIDGVWREDLIYPSIGPSVRTFVATLPTINTIYIHPLTAPTMIIRVVPGPASLASVCVGLGAMGSRRRREPAIKPRSPLPSSQSTPMPHPH